MGTQTAMFRQIAMASALGVTLLAGIAVQGAEPPRATTPAGKVIDTQPETPAPRRSLIPAFVLGGVGAATLVGGVVLIGVAESKRSDAKALADETGHGCAVDDPAPQGKCLELADVASSADTFGNVGIGGLVVAGIAGGAAAAYLLWPASKTTHAGSVRVMPVGGVGGGGVTVAGAF